MHDPVTPETGSSSGCSYDSFRAALAERFSTQTDAIIERTLTDINADINCARLDKQIREVAVPTVIRELVTAFSSENTADTITNFRTELKGKLATSTVSESEFLAVYQHVRKRILEVLRSETRELLPRLEPVYILDLLHQLYLYEEALFSFFNLATNSARQDFAAGVSAEGYRLVMNTLNSTPPSNITHIDAYPLAGNNTALVLWNTTTEHVLAHLEDMFSVNEFLLIPSDTVDLVCWTKAPYAELVTQLAQQDLPKTWRVAVGDTGFDIAGFRTTYQQAFDTHRVVSLSGEKGDRVTYYHDISSLFFLLQSPEQAAEWVRSILGPLAESTPDAERLRETLYTYWRCDKNVSRTATRMFLHRNTVNYRITQAKHILPAHSWDNSLNIMLALTYMHYIPIPAATPTGN